jgi:hypothetical protein
MKICWDNLEKVKFTKYGNFKIGVDTYIEVDSCEKCHKMVHSRKGCRHIDLRCGEIELSENVKDVQKEKP